MDVKSLDRIQEEVERLVTELQQTYKAQMKLCLVGGQREGQITNTLLAEARMRQNTEQLIHDVKELQELDGVLDLELLVATQ